MTSNHPSPKYFEQNAAEEDAAPDPTSAATASDNVSGDDKPEPSDALSNPVASAGNPGGFNYRALDPALASEARQAAQRIRSHCRTQALTLIEIGRDLVSIKERLLHGQFRAWL